MPLTAEEQERAESLAQTAIQSLSAGKTTDATKALREATALAPQHPKVKEAWLAVKEQEEKSPLLDLCRTWVRSKDEHDGEAVLKFIKTQDLSSKTAEQALDILMEFKGEDDILDEVTGLLLEFQSAQALLAGCLQRHPTETYYQFFERGDDSIEGLLKVLLNRGAWEDEASFVKGHRDCFMLCLAMMMEEALEHAERAMKGIARLLASYSEDLKGIVDADGFEVILSSLDIRVPNSLRSQATLATVKLLELAPETAQNLISKYVTNRVQKGTTDGLVKAFSAAAAIFPITKEVAGAFPDGGIR